MRWLRYLGCGLVMGFAPSVHSQNSVAQDAMHPGQVVYERSCGGCHNNPEATRAPALASLRTLNRATVEYAITIGYMKMQAKRPDAARARAAARLACARPGRTAGTGWRARVAQESARRIDAAAQPIAATFGLGARNLRRQTAAETGLTTADFAEARTRVGRSRFRKRRRCARNRWSPADTVFVAATDAGRLFALDTQSGCVKWQFESSVPLRSSLSYGEIEQRQARHRRGRCGRRRRRDRCDERQAAVALRRAPARIESHHRHAGHSQGPRLSRRCRPSRSTTRGSIPTSAARRRAPSSRSI